MTLIERQQLETIQVMADWFYEKNHDEWFKNLSQEIDERIEDELW